MANLSNAKTYGGIGAILLLVGGVIPYAGPIISIVGLILIFLGVKTISEVTSDEEIFKNFLLSFIFNVIAFVSLFSMLLIGFGAAGGISWAMSLETANITDFSSFWNYFGDIIIAALIGFLVAWIFLIIGAIYLKKSYQSIAQHTNVKYFETTATLYLIGSITVIILIGFLILFIARIFEIIAYFSLPDTLQTNKYEIQSE
jgi:uncharacterized membrane protein